ncbi:RNA-binding protein [halophilic archaeon]|nr:RNA-binding protein [halophilic archaeon]
MSRVRVRGIYTTALTHLLADAFDVVQASPPIRRRFDREFETGEYDATVETTDDRQGVGVFGSDAGTVGDELADVGRDTLHWTDAAPRGAVFDGVVHETMGSGAVVDLGEREGFLPFRKVDRRVHEGDAVRVQVHDPAAPWDRDRPLLDTDVAVFGGVASLSKGVERVVADAPDEASERELARTTEMLPTDVPDGWGVRWEYAAADASVDEMDAALDRVATAAETVDDALADAPDPGDAGAGESLPRRLAAPEGTAWLWFGRESRFELDAARRAVTTTMAGHHRVKAAAESASTAVDFVEDLCDPGESFPTGPVLRQFGPAEGETVRIRHGKPDGRCFSLGRGEVTELAPAEGKLTVRRRMSAGGDYDALGVPREDGDVAVTKLREGRWWYPTVYRDEDGDVKGTYVNVCTPVEVFPSSVRYVDLHVDVVKFPDGRVERVDDDELDDAVRAGHVPEALAEKARAVAASVTSALG